jgi:glycosyltransferase involved in cell wall biosynthesis
VLQTLIPDENLRKAMGSSARKLVETRYTWDRVASMTETAYLEYLEEYPTKKKRRPG